MIGAFLLFFLYRANRKILLSKCVDISTSSIQDSQEFADKFGNPASVLFNSIKTSTNIGVNYKIHKYLSGKELIFVSYSIDDAITKNSFLSQFAVSLQLQGESFFPYNTYCFKKSMDVYLIYKPKKSFTPDIIEVDRSRLEHVKEVLISMMRILQAVEATGSVYTDMQHAFFSSIGSGEIQLNPLSLTSVCSVNSKCYVLSPTPDPHFILPADTLKKKDEKGRTFHVLSPQPKWNIFIFLESLKDVRWGTNRFVKTTVVQAVDKYLAGRGSSEEEKFSWLEVEKAIRGCREVTNAKSPTVYQLDKNTGEYVSVGSQQKSNSRKRSRSRSQNRDDRSYIPFAKRNKYS